MISCHSSMLLPFTYLQQSVYLCLSLVCGWSSSQLTFTSSAGVWLRTPGIRCLSWAATFISSITRGKLVLRTILTIIYAMTCILHIARINKHGYSKILAMSVERNKDKWKVWDWASLGWRQGRFAEVAAVGVSAGVCCHVTVSPNHRHVLRLFIQVYHHRRHWLVQQVCLECAVSVAEMCVAAGRQAQLWYLYSTNMAKIDLLQ